MGTSTGFLGPGIDTKATKVSQNVLLRLQVTQRILGRKDILFPLFISGKDQNNTFCNGSLDFESHGLLQRVVLGCDGGSAQRLHQEGHPALGGVVGDGVVPRVGNADSVCREEARGVRVQLPGARLDVVLCVILQQNPGLQLLPHQHHLGLYFRAVRCVQRKGPILTAEQKVLHTRVLLTLISAAES